MGIWIRPDGSQYEGSWVNNLKHGKGTQIFPDGTKYIGEFAKGYEHGNGMRTHKDGSVYDGRFRFGRKDGKVGSLVKFNLLNSQLSEPLFNFI